MITEEDKRIVKDIAEACFVLAAKIDIASDAGIRISFVNFRQIGKINETFFLSEAVRIIEEHISP